MRQLIIPGFPEGSHQINSTVRFLNKENRVVWFVGLDNYFEHPNGDRAGLAFIVACLMHNSHARACDFEKAPLSIPHRTLMNWGHKLREEGHDSFFRPGRKRKGTVLTPEKIIESGQLLSNGLTIAETARRIKVDSSTLRKAVSSGRVKIIKSSVTEKSTGSASTKSARTKSDAEAGMGTACTRTGERIMAAIGLVGDGVTPRYEHCEDVHYAGVMASLPALSANGLFSGLGKHLSTPKGFYSAMSILLTLAFMALSRIKRPEGLRHQPPGELGKSIGLDRVPEVRTLRRKISWMSKRGNPRGWMKELSKAWMKAEPEEAGYLYLDGHVRVYHGSNAILPRRYVSRERLCLRGTTDYWINDAIGRPFFVVSKTITEGLEAILIRDILPQLLETVPGQPTKKELKENSTLPRFVMIFDREGSSYKLLSALWQHRVAAITYRKSVKEKWPIDLFKEMDVPSPDGGNRKINLATQETTLCSGKKSMPVMEVRRLSDTGHQTAIITSAMQMGAPQVAGRMFSRWCQENYFAYMMEHYEIDGLMQYGYEELPGTTMVVNPAWREMDIKVRESRHLLRDLHAVLGKMDFDNNQDIEKKAETHQDIQMQMQNVDEMKKQRKVIPRKIMISKLPKQERPHQLLPLGKALTDTVKMIAYRAETAMVALLRPYLENKEEARPLVRELLVSSADIIPDEQAKTLTVCVHRMASPCHDKAISSLLKDISETGFKHPQTGARMIFCLT